MPGKQGLEKQPYNSVYCGWAICIAPLLPLFGSPAEAAAIDPFELSPEQLFNATVMSVSKTSEKLMDAPAAITVLSNEDIRRSGATTIPEMLRLVPGVQVARVNSAGWAVSVRGFNGGLANKLLVLMDGREVYDGLFSGVYWDVQDTVLEDIDRIEIIRGPGASLWGANAVNGVINIITKRAHDTQGGLASLIAGNQERSVNSMRYGGQFGENGHYRIYGKYLNRDHQETLSGADAKDAWEATRGGFRADWKNGSNDFTVQGDVYRSDTGQYRIVPIPAAPFSQLNIEDIAARGGNILGRWNRNLENGAKLTVQNYLDYTSRDQELIRDDRWSFDVEAQIDLPPNNRHNIVTGARYRYSYDNLTVTQNANVTFNDATRHDQLFSGFIQDKITLDPDRWYLTLGTKLDHNDFTGFELQPNARLQYHPSGTQIIWGSVSRAVRTPSRLETDLSIVQLRGAAGFQFLTVGSEDFDSEELTAYELGYRQQITPDLSLDIATFYNDYDKLATLPLASFVVGPPTILTFAYTNDTEGEAYGVETTVDWHVTDAWRLSAAYTFLNLTLHGPANALGPEDPEDQSPQQQFNVRSQWDITRDIAFDTTMYYVDELPGFRVDDYLRLDARLGWQITDGIQFNLVGQNLFASSHREFIAPDDIHTPPSEIEPSIYGQVVWQF